jgi:hypothetical protein
MATTVEAPRSQRPSAGGAPDRRLYRIGAISGFVATALAIVSNAAHPRHVLGTTQETLRTIADYGPWRVVHLGIILAAVFAVIAFVAVYRSISDGPSPWARPALGLILISTAVALVSFSIDGFAMSAVADDWVASSGAQQATLLSAATLLQHFDAAVFTVTLMAFFGLLPIVGGIALWTDGSYPRGVAATAVAAGLFGFAAGVTQFLAGEITRFAFLFLLTIGSVLLTVWLFLVSVLLWRKSQAAS